MSFELCRNVIASEAKQSCSFRIVGRKIATVTFGDLAMTKMTIMTQPDCEGEARGNLIRIASPLRGSQWHDSS